MKVKYFFITMDESTRIH